MRYTFIILFVLSFINSLIAQTNLYRYEYRLRLNDRPSYYFYSFDTNHTQLTDSSIQWVKINVVDEESKPIEFVNFSVITDSNCLKFFTIDTAIIKIPLSLNGFKIEVYHPSYSGISISIPMDWNRRVNEVTIVLGKSFNLLKPILRSKQPLTINELIMITQKISLCKEKRIKCNFLKSNRYILNFEI